MQGILMQIITGAVLGFLSFFVYAFSMHMLKTGKTILKKGNVFHVVWGTVLIAISAGVLIGAPLALLLYSPIAFVACAVVGWLYWFKNLKL